MLRKLIVSLLGLLAVAGLSVPAQAQINNNTRTVPTYQVVLDNNPINHRVPAWVEPQDGMVAFQIINNSSEAVYFDHNGQKDYIPNISQNTVTVPYSGDGRYHLVDINGNEVLAWQSLVMGASSNASSSEISARNQQHSRWSSELQTIIRNQQVSIPVFEQNDPPHHDPIQSSAPASRGVVRGFW